MTESTPARRGPANGWKLERTAERSKEMAPQVGLEPTTLRLTAGCSAIELLRSVDSALPRPAALNIVFIISFRSPTEKSLSPAGPTPQPKQLSRRRRAACRHVYRRIKADQNGNCYLFRRLPFPRH